jgi:hypothetical protein
MIRGIVCVLCAALLAASEGSAERWQETSAKRVAALNRDQPVEYLLLAEEIADRAPRDASGDDDCAQAVQLASMAGALDFAGLGRSAALFVLDVSRDPVQRARMAALAQVLDGAHAARTAAPKPAAVLGLAQAFTAYKRGMAARARTALDTPGTAELLDAHPALLAGGSTRFRADCAAMRDGVPPLMTAAQEDALIALITASLAPEPRTWSESLALHGPDPLVDFDLSDPAALFGVTLPSERPKPAP